MGEAMSGTAAAPTARVLSVSRVVPSLAPAERAGVGHVKLSFLDVPWIKLTPIQRVFLYELPGNGDEFSEVVARLKESLAATLALYLPLAGKLARVADTGDFFVDCCSDLRVAFVEVEVAEGAVDVRRLAGDEALDVSAFHGLVPKLDARALPAPVLSVQATRLGAGGLALGLSVLHAVVNGAALWQFTEAWATASREGSPVINILGPPHSLCKKSSTGIISPQSNGNTARHFYCVIILNRKVTGVSPSPM
ncbi:hypothetical protein C2845_PM17G09290 [Panicum miliaceum]|uniref:BAHD acyltransferase n=1 Tax=Panicum miliaceum TaxID=4540 RepID=A0A3L6PZX7_PANMI|nr:hypothetical protein C2845_PM17G09290 [Panicum miliaceum]